MIRAGYVLLNWTALLAGMAGTVWALWVAARIIAREVGRRV